MVEYMKGRITDMPTIRYNRFSTKLIETKLDNNVSVIIIADEPPKGMKQNGPKPLLEYNGNYLLQYQIGVISELMKNAEIIVITGFESEKVCKLRKYFSFRVVENVLFNQYSSIEGIRLAMNNTRNQKFLFISGDCFFTELDIFNVVKQNSIITNRIISNNNIGAIISEDIITNFSYGLPDKWTGIMYLEDNAALDFQNYVNQSKNNKNLIHQGLEYIINRNHKVFNITSETAGKIERGYNENISFE